MAGEFALIERLLKQAKPERIQLLPGVLLGPGDDCALIAPPAANEVLAITTDMLVEGTHFLGTDSPADLGWKTLAVNLSDLAAMGAVPRYVTLAVSLLATDESTGWVDQFFGGFTACAKQYDVTLIGGDTTCGARAFSVTAFGTLKPQQALRRSGARALDDIWVSGTPGMAALGLAHKLGNVVLPETLQTTASAALHHPFPRIELGLALAGLAHSCLDVSDGLLQDLGHITQASGLSATLELTALPPPPPGVATPLWQQCLLGGGDDYELLFTASQNHRTEIEALSAQLTLPLHRIGQMQDVGKAGTITLLDTHQRPVDLSNLRQGFDHFA